MSPFPKNLFFAAALAMLLIGCATQTEMKTDRTKLISLLEHEMVSNTSWLRIHAAEGLLDNGHIGRIPELFRPEADTATAPYRIGVWRVLARSTSGAERERFVEKIRKVLHDPQATDRISASESLGKINAAIRADREMILNWLKTADDATAPFPRWNLVLSADSSERANDEAALAKLLSSNDPIARLRAAFALGRLKNLSADSIAIFREQLKVEPADSIARIYFITALLLNVKDEAEIVELEKQLIPYLNNGKSNELLEIGISTGLRGNPDDLQILEPLLKNPDVDARIGAANGMLQLLK
jgi:HEAT repeat protein